MKKKTLFLYVSFLLSWFWVLSLYLRYGLSSPIDFSPLILQDLEFLGPYAIILDLFIMVALFYVITPYHRRGSDATGDSSEDEPLDNRNNK
jgi:hypothetical protein